MRVRSLEKENAKERFDYQIKKERTIGVDPIVEHRYIKKYPDFESVRKDWQKKSEEYDRESL